MADFPAPLLPINAVMPSSSFIV
ncbi:uncharacterized protein METZ01_LOCUS374277 [marine metagenome]|uniref:Uncharacterized protein n=1 Tax=marine metagenome TaxID=408172 RepID=A0A382THI1_9ZZZZ